MNSVKEIIAYYEDNFGTLWPIVNEYFLYEWSCCNRLDSYYLKYGSVPYSEISMKCLVCQPERWHFIEKDKEGKEYTKVLTMANHYKFDMDKTKEPV